MENVQVLGILRRFIWLGKICAITRAQMIQGDSKNTVY